MGKIKRSHFELGIKLSAQGKYHEAAKEYMQVEENDPSFNQAQINLKWLRFKALDTSMNQKTPNSGAKEKKTLAKHLGV